MRMAARKVPNVARIEIVDFAAARRVDQRGSHAPFENESPFRGRRVPVQFAGHARLEAHRDAGDSLGNRQLLDRGFFAVAASCTLPFDFSRANLKVGSSLPERIGSGTLFLKGKSAPLAEKLIAGHLADEELTFRGARSYAARGASTIPPAGPQAALSEN